MERNALQIDIFCDNWWFHSIGRIDLCCLNLQLYGVSFTYSQWQSFFLHAIYDEKVRATTNRDQAHWERWYWGNLFIAFRRFGALFDFVSQFFCGSGDVDWLEGVPKDDSTGNRARGPWGDHFHGPYNFIFWCTGKLITQGNIYGGIYVEAGFFNIHYS